MREENMNTTLLIMAAGIGSRFGKGIKQLEPVDASNHIIMDYSIHDAIEAGFNHVVFIIRKDIEKEFKEVIGDRITTICSAHDVTVDYAFQDINDIPGYIKGNLRLVLSVIKRFSGSHENLDDLFQIGCIGLIKSIDNFNPDLQVKFSTYAVPMIIGEIRRYLRDNNSIRVSRSLRDTAYKAIHAKEVLSRNSFKEPTLQEIAAESGVAAEDILYALDAIQSPVSLYDPVYTDGGDTLYVMDQISDKKNKEENWVEKLSLSDAMNRLSERENFIINLRFFEGKTQMEVADEIHISQAQVSRLEKSALKTIRQYLTV